MEEELKEELKKEAKTRASKKLALLPVESGGARGHGHLAKAWGSTFEYL